VAAADGETPLDANLKRAWPSPATKRRYPFEDGNGRMARCLQTLVLAREKIVAPAFPSIEEYLGANTSDDYDVLAMVGQGSWNPRNDPRPWIDFSLLAHYRQAATLLRRLQEYESPWVALVTLQRNVDCPNAASVLCVKPRTDYASGGPPCGRDAAPVVCRGPPLGSTRPSS